MKILQYLMPLGLCCLISCEKSSVDLLPKVETLPATIIDATHVTINGNVIDEGRTAITARGFCWGYDSLPSMNDDFSTCINLL